MELGVLRVIGVLLVASCDVGVAIWDRYAAEPTPLPVSYTAHLMGALAGLCVGLVVLKHFERKLAATITWWIALAVYLACVLVAVLWNVFIVTPGAVYSSWYTAVVDHAFFLIFFPFFFFIFLLKTNFEFIKKSWKKNQFFFNSEVDELWGGASVKRHDEPFPGRGGSELRSKAPRWKWPVTVSGTKREKKKSKFFMLIRSIRTMNNFFTVIMNARLTCRIFPASKTKACRELAEQKYSNRLWKCLCAPQTIKESQNVIILYKIRSKSVLLVIIQEKFSVVKLQG